MNGDSPMDVDCPRYCEFLGTFSVLGKVAVLVLVTILGMTMVTIRGKVTVLRRGTLLEYVYDVA